MEDSRRLVAFEADGSTLRVRDALHEGALALRAGREVDPQPALTDLFAFPVDDAVSFETDCLCVSSITSATLRDESGDHLGMFSGHTVEQPRGTYVLGIEGSVKVYVRIPDVALTGGYESVERDDATLRVTLAEPRTVTVGARSLHERPEATITVPDDPAAFAEALPYLGASIKEFSPERSWPTLRGHPPAISRGESLRVPDGLERPETGVTIRVPTTYASLYEVAPLAYYLGAAVEPAETPELVLANGYVEPLETPEASLAERADAVLRRTLLMDSLVRVGGYFSNSRYEYEAIAGELPFYPPELYDATVSDQLMEYLEVSPSLLDRHLPDRPLRATLRDGPAGAELVPHLVHDLASIAVDRQESRPSGSADDAVGLSADGAVGCSDDDAVAVGRSARPVPPGETLLVREAYETALDRSPPEATDAEILIVSGDDDPGAWREVRDAATDGIEPAVAAADLLVDPTVREFDAAIGDGYDLVLCLLSATDGGIACADGVAEPTALGSTPAWGMLLAGSDALGVAASLCERGVVTALATDERPAPGTVGRLLRCLVRGHSFAVAARFLGREEVGAYRTVGAQPRSVLLRDGESIPFLLDLTAEAVDGYRVTLWGHPTAENRTGGVCLLHEDVTLDTLQLSGSAVDHPVPCSAEQAASLLADPDYLVRLNGDSYHGEPEPTPEFVRESAREWLDGEASR